MITPFIQKAAQIVRSMMPVGTCILFLLFGGLVWPNPYIGPVSPLLGLIAIYYWAIYRPDLVRPYIVFVLGLLNDVIHMYPIGLSACVYLALYQLVFTYRRYFVGQIFSMLWIGFAIVGFIAVLFNWLILALFSNKMVAVIPVVLQYMITVALFPFPAWILIRLQRSVLTQR